MRVLWACYFRLQSQPGELRIERNVVCYKEWKSPVALIAYKSDAFPSHWQPDTMSIVNQKEKSLILQSALSGWSEIPVLVHIA